MGDKIGALIVDNSKLARQTVRAVLENDPEIEVLAEANETKDTVELVARLRPHIVLIDINMPKNEGLRTIAQIMAFHPTPIIILSSSDTDLAIKRTFEALSAGALEVCEKPISEQKDNSDFLKTVKLVSGLKVITHLAGKHDHDTPAQQSSGVTVDEFAIFIAASTGGPSALKKILSNISPDIKASIIIAQHIAKGFMAGLVSWLAQECKLTIKEAKSGDRLKRGTVLFCPAGSNIIVAANQTIKIDDTSATDMIKPSADILFNSAAKVYGPKAVGVILTGMGSDGAKGLLKIKENGGVTVAQDEATSVVFGMPKKAISFDAVQKILPLKDIGGYLNRIIGADDEPDE